MIADYLKTHWVEITGAVLSVIYLFLSIKQKSALWIFGFISSAFYVVIFFQSKFYADMSLQFYYLVVSVYGWINWQRKTDETKNSTLPTTRISGKKQYLEYIAGTVVVYLIYFFILYFLTDSPFPIADSVVGAFSVIATWMLAKKKIENWIVWIFVDAFAAGLYFYKNLYPTAVLFIVYTIMAVVGYFQWNKEMNQSKNR